MLKKIIEHVGANDIPDSTPPPNGQEGDLPEQPAAAGPVKAAPVINK